jgi:hypothetical protein
VESTLPTFGPPLQRYNKYLTCASFNQEKIYTIYVVYVNILFYICICLTNKRKNMGCFSFKCKVTKEAVLSSSFDGDAVHLFLLKDGKVIEKMYGNYDSYGRVFSAVKEDDDTSMTEFSSYKWNLPWGEVCDLMFDNDTSNGIAAVLDEVFTGEIPTTRSEDDPNQGWGDEDGDDEPHNDDTVAEPYHKIY